MESLTDRNTLDRPSDLLKAKLEIWLKGKTKYDPIYLDQLAKFGSRQLIRRALAKLEKEGKIVKKRAWPVFYIVSDGFIYNQL